MPGLLKSGRRTNLTLQYNPFRFCDYLYRYIILVKVGSIESEFRIVYA